MTTAKSFILSIVVTVAATFPAGMTLSACASSPEQRADRQQSLAAVISRVDVPRLLECAHYGPTKEAAACLGARALTEGLEEAMHQATMLAENAQEASNPQAGAADMSAEQEAVLAADLDAALDHLALEIAAANAA
ncbi:MAG: hypothetical protein ACRBN8_19765 [Nannocystales bacterium]